MAKVIKLEHPARNPPDTSTQPKPTAIFKKVVCPTCGKFVCKATPGSMVEVLCNRCKTESVTVVAA